MIFKCPFHQCSNIYGSDASIKCRVAINRNQRPALLRQVGVDLMFDFGIIGGKVVKLVPDGVKMTT